MNDVVKALQRRVRAVDRSHDIPYIAGYSVDATTIFIDRHRAPMEHVHARATGAERNFPNYGVGDPGVSSCKNDRVIQ